MKNLLTKYARLLLLCFVSAVLMISKTAITSQAATGALFDLPQKYVIADHETFNAFTTSKNNTTSCKLTDYQLPIKLSNNNNSLCNISVKSIPGASGQAGDYALQLVNLNKSSTNGTYIVFYINEKYESTNAIKNDSIIFETDIMLSQTDAEVKLSKLISDSSFRSFFKADGTIGQYEYSAGVWKHLLIDMDFPKNIITIYYDHKVVETIEMTTKQAEAGQGIVQFNLANNNTTTAAVAFDNLNVYTVAPYSESISYVSDSVEYSAIDNCVIPCGSDKLIFTLDDLSDNEPKNVTANISLCKDGKELDIVKAYSKSTKKFTFTLTDNIIPGNYSIKYSAGLLMTHTVGSTTTELALSDSYEQPIRIVETDKINLIKASDGSYNAEVYYNSSFLGSATLIIAAYNVSDDKQELSSLNYEDFDLTAGLNKLTLSHSDLSADCTKAMLWSDWSATPLLRAKIVQ